ncbi:MAG TPA: DUF4397 domain-containing protein [Terriglobales bacterium]|jgi:hypothetical protein|nr:DUF4397 domain-containing protein [Terriglobales bacterium]
MLRVTKILFFVVLAVLGIFSSSCGSDHSKVRFVHAAVSSAPPDVALDVAVDGKTVATALAYGGVSPATGYLTIAAGSRKVEMSTTGTTDDLINSTIDFASGRQYTLVATGFVTPPKDPNFNIAAALLTDDNSAPSSGNVKLRILHAAPYNGVAPNPPALDVYIVPPSTDITGVTPNVSSLLYGQASPYQNVPAASNRVIVTAAGTKTPAIIDETPDSFAAGQIRTLVVVNVLDGVTPSSTPIVLSDLN